MCTKILIIDHNDSFTYNLVQLFEELGQVMVTVKNVACITSEDLKQANALVLSPGPGLPTDYPAVQQLLQMFHLAKPILGVCLGLQHIITFFGGSLYNQERVLHGTQITLQHTATHFLYNGLELPVKVGLYHSWAGCHKKLPQKLIVTATSASGTIMSIKHATLPITGVQFHPESYMTPGGKRMMENWVATIRK